MNCFCIKCGDEYNPKRRKLGYNICLDCGSIAARKEARRRSKCCAPAFNKGAYMYVTSKKMARDVGK
jgi:hypothetical protein